ncbi:PREDICTED: monoacylglycerol lipase ABHD6-like [Camelina sativa]|uniref:Monoacylglycerol lipase ABHD6-like n=1 Tax=Camelina sativa TaxID=90675 RepID=A0ABM0T0Y8_CAMSA|nr:PREDICTED: monoacylglycerol lipase ABHD6-like [Camelina sativa]
MHTNTTILFRIIITKNSLMASMKLMFRILRHAICIAITLLKSLVWCLFDNFDYPILIKLADTFLSLYFIVFCDLRPITVDLNDGETTLHFWISGHRKINRPNLLMLHGYGANSKWQFITQVTDLSRSFNLFIPDLVFFGRSYSRNTDRSVEFQARSIVGGLKRLGCGGGKDGGDLSVYSISYGGFVAYRIAKIWPEMVERLVIVSSGVGFTQQQKVTEMKKHGGYVSEILVPSSPRDLRLLVRVSMNTGLRFLDWVPDFILSQFISVMYETNREELLDLAKNLLEREEEPEFFAISQKTLIVWGDKDQVFPLEHGRRLHRNLPNSSLEVLKEIGHGVNIEAPTTLNNLIISFVLGVVP